MFRDRCALVRAGKCLIFAHSAIDDGHMAVTDSDDARSTQIIARGGRPDGAEALSSSGFRARLDGLSLFDLVQMECIARARRVVRVASAGRVGYLFFMDGEIFHATTKNLTGERAALEMLEWTDGTFEPCNIVWPEKGSIKMGWQNLLLGAATSKDERTAGKLVHLPSRRAPSTPPASGTEGQDEADLTSDVEELADATGVPDEERVKAMSERPSQNPPNSQNAVQRAVRIDSTGRVLSSSGETGDLADFAAYAARVGELIGQSLGLGRFMALDIACENRRSILRVEDAGRVVVVEAKNPDALAAIARRAGL